MPQQWDNDLVSGHHWSKFRPKNDNVLIRRVKSEKITSGGIIIPDAHQKKVAQGEVLTVGPGRFFADGTRSIPEVKPGDRVLFSKHAEEITLDGEVFVLVGALNIDAVLEE